MLGLALGMGFRPSEAPESVEEQTETLTRWTWQSVPSDFSHLVGEPVTADGLVRVLTVAAPHILA